MLPPPALSAARSLFDKGRLLTAVMRRERVTESEIRMAIRAEGVAALEVIEAVVLETDGSFSVIKNRRTIHARL